MKNLKQYIIEFVNIKNIKVGNFKLYFYPKFNHYYVKLESDEDVFELIGNLFKKDNKTIPEGILIRLRKAYKNGAFVRINPFGGTYKIFTCCVNNKSIFLSDFKYVKNITADDFNLETWLENKWAK